MLDSKVFPKSESLNKHLDKVMLSSLRSFLEKPGKKVRAHLVELGLSLVEPQSEKREICRPISEMVEALHGGSLIIDDIQDENQQRRGAPCFHQEHGMARAMNSGSWLYFWAFKRLSELKLEQNLEHRLYEEFYETLFYGHIGQAFDLSSNVNEIDISEIPEICRETMRLKTGMLTSLSLTSGALLSEKSHAHIKEIKEIGEEFGILLQMYNDLKDLKTLARENNQVLWQEFRTLKPHLLFWLIAEKEEKRFGEFIDSLRTDRISSFQSLLGASDIFSLASVMIRKREENWFKKVEKVTKLFNNPMSEEFTKLILKLRTDYEKC